MVPRGYTSPARLCVDVECSVSIISPSPSLVDSHESTNLLQTSFSNECFSRESC